MARSRAYPVVDLERGEDLLHQVVKQLGTTPNDRDAIAVAMGHTAGNGLAARKVAALVHYGLLDVEDGLYRPTELADQLLNPLDEKERRSVLDAAARTPTLFGELLNKFEGDGRLPTALSAILVRHHGITRRAASDVAAIFRRTCEYAGICDADGLFAGTGRAADQGDSYVDVAPTTAPQSSAAGASSSAAGASQMSARVQAPNDDSQVAVISLAHGHARLEVPKRLTARDRDKIALWLQMVSMDIEEES